MTKSKCIFQGILALCLMFPPVFLIPYEMPGFRQEAAAGLGGRIRKIAKQVVAAALAGVSTSILQVEAAMQRAQQIKHNFEQYKLMAKGAKSLPTWETQVVVEEMLELHRLAEQGRAIAYNAAQLDEEFRSAYPGFEHYQSNPRTGESHQTFAERYRDWFQYGRDSIRGALLSAGLQSRQFQTETARVKELENKLMSAEGAQQVLQAGSLIASGHIDQLQKLRQLVMSQTQIQGNYNALQLDRQALEDATLERLLAPGTRVNPDKFKKNPLPFLGKKRVTATSDEEVSSDDSDDE